MEEVEEEEEEEGEGKEVELLLLFKVLEEEEEEEEGEMPCSKDSINDLKESFSSSCKEYLSEKMDFQLKSVMLGERRKGDKEEKSRGTPEKSKDKEEKGEERYFRFSTESSKVIKISFNSDCNCLRVRW